MGAILERAGACLGAEALSPISSSDPRLHCSRAGLEEPPGHGMTPRWGPVGSSLLPRPFLPPSASSRLRAPIPRGPRRLRPPASHDLSETRSGSSLGWFSSGPPARPQKPPPFTPGGRGPPAARAGRARAAGDGTLSLGPQARRRLSERFAFHHPLNSKPAGPQGSARGGRSAAASHKLGRVRPEELARTAGPGSLHPLQTESFRPAPRKLGIPHRPPPRHPATKPTASPGVLPTPQPTAN